MMILLSMAVALAAFFAVMLWLDPARRKQTALAAVAGAIGLAGGTAHAHDDEDREECIYNVTAPGDIAACFVDDEGTPDPIGPGMPDPTTGNPYPSPDDVSCRIGHEVTAFGMLYGVWSLFIPEPILSKIIGASGVALGGIGWWMTTAYCGGE